MDHNSRWCDEQCLTALAVRASGGRIIDGGRRIDGSSTSWSVSLVQPLRIAPRRSQQNRPKAVICLQKSRKCLCCYVVSAVLEQITNSENVCSGQNLSTFQRSLRMDLLRPFEEPDLRIIIPNPGVSLLNFGCLISLGFPVMEFN